MVASISMRLGGKRQRRRLGLPVRGAGQRVGQRHFNGLERRLISAGSSHSEGFLTEGFVQFLSSPYQETLPDRGRDFGKGRRVAITKIRLHHQVISLLRLDDFTEFVFWKGVSGFQHG